jgi:hypothetical protein
MKFEGKLRDEFKAAVRYWADNHPHKNQPGLSLGGDFLTPLQIAEAVETETEFGLDFIEIVEHGATAANESAEQVIAHFRRPSPPQP